MALEQAYRQAGADLEPQQRQLEGVWVALWENETKIQGMLEAIGTGSAVGPLLAMLNEKAAGLQLEKERLLAEQRWFALLLSPLERNVDAKILRERLVDFEKLAAVADPEELQRLLRWTFRGIEWEMEGPNRMQIYALRFLLNSLIPSVEISHLTTQA